MLIGSNSDTLHRVVELLIHDDENVLRSATDAISLIALKCVTLRFRTVVGAGLSSLWHPLQVVAAL